MKETRGGDDAPFMPPPLEAGTRRSAFLNCFPHVRLVANSIIGREPLGQNRKSSNKRKGWIGSKG